MKDVVTFGEQKGELRVTLKGVEENRMNLIIGIEQESGRNEKRTYML